MRSVLDRDLTGTETAHIAERLYAIYRTKRAMQGMLLPIWRIARPGDREAFELIVNTAKGILTELDRHGDDMEKSA